MKDFKKYFIIPALPEEVYLALTLPHTLKLWTGAEAVMSTEVGSEFSLWEDSIIGKNLAFEAGKKIVQQWYFDGQEDQSIVTIKLHVHKQGTSAELLHTNIPDDVYEEMVNGWNENYFGELVNFYN
jgi:activator of HSP90 ATPase